MNDTVHKMTRHITQKKLFLLFMCMAGVALLLFSQKANDQTKSGTTLSYRETTQHTIEQMVRAVSGDEEAYVYLTWEQAATDQSVFSDTTTEKKEATPVGIAVFCQNAADYETQLALCQMLSQTFDVSYHRIYIAQR